MIQPGGGLALLPARCESLVLADCAFICTNKVRALPSYAVMVDLWWPLIWRLLHRNAGHFDVVGISV